MASMRRIDLTGSSLGRESHLGPTTGALIPWGIRVAVLAAMVLAALALWSTAAYADGEETAEPVWSADMTVVEYTSVSIGAASADLFSNVGGSGNLQIKSLWSHIPDRDLRLAFTEDVPNAADYTLQVGDLSLEFPSDSSGASSFKWADVDVDWEEGQLIRVRIVLTADSDAQQTNTPNTPATGVPTISGTAQVGGTLAADTSGIEDEDGMTNVSYAYRWIRNDDAIPDATDSSYTLTDDDHRRTITLKVSFIDDKGNSETLISAATEEVGEGPEFLVSNLGVNVAVGIMRPLNATRSGFAQAFTTGAKTGGYALGSIGIQVSDFADGSTVGDHLRVTINGAASGGEPDDAHCTLSNPLSFSTPGMIAFEAPIGAGSCPQLTAETTYFVVIEWLNPSGTDAFALIPQTFPTDEAAATEEDPGGAEGWSIADQAYYLSVSSDARTWTEYDETASFKIKVEEGDAAAKVNSPATGVPTISGTAQVGETLTADTAAIEDEDGLDDTEFSYQWLADDTDIDGATSSTYELTSSEQGKTIQVKVTFTDDAENEETLTSAATEAVAAKATGLPAISGTAQVGETLTTDTSAITDEDGLENVDYSYQWIRIDDGTDTDIAGATDSTYTLVLADQGKTIQVRVTFTDDAENEESLTSEATEAVAAAPNRAATGAPTISGTAQVGETLTADTSAITDEDGLTNVAYSYQWIRSDDGTDTDIAGATDSTYTLVLADQGKTIQVRATFTDDAENEESLTSAATEAVAAKATGLPAISGTPQVGETLTADTSAITDEDGLESVAYSYQWIRSDDGTDTDIAGATDSTYTLVLADQGKTIKVRVTFTDDAENEESLTSEATEAVAAAPNRAATGAPTISGTAQVGETLTAGTSDIADEDGLTNVAYSYQWMAGGSDIAGVTGSSYVLTPSEQGQTVQVRVTFTDDAENEETLTSAATTAVAATDNTAPTGLPTITGTPQVGETLTADTSAIEDEDGLENVAYTYQWIAGGTDIDGATDATYTLTEADQGKTVKVKVTFTDDAENEETLTSEATAAVAAAPNRAATGAPTISGTPQVGETLTADISGIADADGLANVAYSYQWMAGGSDIAGATGSSYELTSSEQGQTIQVRVTFTDDADNEETLTSVATVAVAAAPNRAATGAPTISGTPQVGETLTADTSAIDDTDGLTNVAYSYQWLAGGSDIAGATGSSYVLTSSEQGQTVQVRVTFTDDAENEETLTSAATAAVAAAPNRAATGAPTISGTPQVGETLTADLSGIADADGLANVAYSYQWMAGGSDIAGATGSSYVLTSGERGRTVQVRVTFTDDAENQETLTSVATEVVAAAPVPLTVSVTVSAPTTHDGSSEFTFDIEFSEEFGLSYRTLKFDAFDVTGGSVERAQRTDKPSNIPWRIAVKPHGTGDVTIELPVTTDCNSEGAICTGDGRKLSNRLEVTVRGPN